MTIFDTIRYPVTEGDLLRGDLLDRLPIYLRNRWWAEVMEYRYKMAVCVDPDWTTMNMKTKLLGFRRGELEVAMYKLRDHISKYGE